jgi:hypothetical protein
LHPPQPFGYGLHWHMCWLRLPHGIGRASIGPCHAWGRRRTQRFPGSASILVAARAGWC